MRGAQRRRREVPPTRRKGMHLAGRRWPKASPFDVTNLLRDGPQSSGVGLYFLAKPKAPQRCLRSAFLQLSSD